MSVVTRKSSRESRGEERRGEDSLKRKRETEISQERESVCMVIEKVSTEEITPNRQDGRHNISSRSLSLSLSLFRPVS